MSIHTSFNMNGFALIPLIFASTCEWNEKRLICWFLRCSATVDARKKWSLHTIFFSATKFSSWEQLKSFQFKIRSGIDGFSSYGAAVNEKALLKYEKYDFLPLWTSIYLTHISNYLNYLVISSLNLEYFIKMYGSRFVFTINVFFIRSNINGLFFWMKEGSGMKVLRQTTHSIE